jgi:hypothetical protein
MDDALNIALHDVVYVLCALTSLACAALLFRSWLRARSSRLLLWSALCFIGLLFNNLFLVADKILFPAVDMTMVTKLPAVIGLALFLFGLIWEDK